MSTAQGAARIADHLGRLGGTTLLVAPEVDQDQLAGLDLAGHVVLRSLHEGPVVAATGGTVLLVVPDRGSLRRATAALGRQGVAMHVGCWFLRQPTMPLGLRPRPEWSTNELVARTSPECFVLASFVQPIEVRSVLVEIARQSSNQFLLAEGWPVLGARLSEPGLWPTGDPAAVVAEDAVLFDHSTDDPPDLILVESELSDQSSVGSSANHAPCLGSRTHDPGDGDRADLGRLPRPLGRRPRRMPYGSRAFVDGSDGWPGGRPTGFDRSATGPAVVLSQHREAGIFLLTGESESLTLDARHGLREPDVPRLRQMPGLALTWEGAAGPQAYVRLVVGLAMAGIPLVTELVPEWARHLLHDELVEALGGKPDLTDPLAREEHSVYLRRAALSRRGSRARRRALARTSGQQHSPEPRVSVLLSTRSPEMVPFALRQVAGQPRADIELVLVTHGFAADPAELARFREQTSIGLTAIAAPTQMPFGAVLNRAADHASGEVFLKLDDDDWYGRDFVLDLLLAREYSGAEIVGCPPEFTFIEPLWLTTRRREVTEQYRPVVAGGTMMVDRHIFRAVGGFRETRKYVDRALQVAVRNAGGSVFRSHGLGYVRRRTGQGHTWDLGLGYFVTRGKSWQQWRGFRPSNILETEPVDLPSEGDLL